MTTHSSGHPKRVFVDSSAYYALSVVRDENHTAAREIFTYLDHASARQFTTRYILAEAHALIIARRRSAREALALLTRIEQSRATTIVPVTEADEQRARAILAQYEDHTFSLTDAISFAVMERLGIADAFTFDRDFTEFGINVLSANSR